VALVLVSPFKKKRLNQAKFERLLSKLTAAAAATTRATTKTQRLNQDKMQRNNDNNSSNNKTVIMNRLPQWMIRRLVCESQVHLVG
jgi:hypothetical protein